MSLYWCETHERVADHAWVDGDARTWVCSMCDQTGFLGAKSKRLLVDLSSLPEHAVERVAEKLYRMLGDDLVDKEYSTMLAEAAIRGFLSSLNSTENGMVEPS